MQKFSTWLLVCFAVMFWMFRVATAFMFARGETFTLQPVDQNLEIPLLFVALICFIFIVRRNWVGPIVYLIAYGGYFGSYIMSYINDGMPALSTDESTNLLFAFVGVILPIFILFDLAFDANRKAHPKDKKTDWYYKNEKYDRNMDDRADKNNYRTL